MTAQELANALYMTRKGITHARMEKLKGAIGRENNQGNPVTLDDVLACLPPLERQWALDALNKKVTV